MEWQSEVSALRVVWLCLPIAGSVMSQDHNKHQSHNITTGQILWIFAVLGVKTFNKKHKTGHIYT